MIGVEFDPVCAIPDLFAHGLSYIFPLHPPLGRHAADSIPMNIPTADTFL